MPTQIFDEVAEKIREAGGGVRDHHRKSPEGRVG